MRRKPVLIAMLAAAVLLAGCSELGSSGSSMTCADIGGECDSSGIGCDETHHEYCGSSGVCCINYDAKGPQAGGGLGPDR